MKHEPLRSSGGPSWASWAGISGLHLSTEKQFETGSTRDTSELGPGLVEIIREDLGWKIIFKINTQYRVQSTRWSGG